MVATLADLKEIGTKGPYNFSKLKFSVIIDAQGKYHLSYHKGLRGTASTTRATKTASRTFAQIADCCVKVTRWYGPNDIERFSAAQFMKARAILLKKSEELRKHLNPDSPLLNSLEIYKMIGAINAETKHRQLWSYNQGPLERYSALWQPEISDLQDAVVNQLMSSFKTLDQTPLVEYFAKEVVSSFAFGPTVSPEAKAALAEAKKKITVAFSSPQCDILGAVNPLARDVKPHDRTLMDLYRTKGTNLMLLPPVMAQHLLNEGLMLDSVVLDKPLEDKTLEALKVLYTPHGEGPYRKLTAALKASMVL